MSFPKLILSLLVFIVAAPVVAIAADCSSCSAFPPLCSNIENCVKSCNLSPFQAQNCMLDGYISLDACKKVYPACQKTDHDVQCKKDCGSYPQLCGQIEHCVKDCNVSNFQAFNCYHSGAISLAECQKVYDQCVNGPPCLGCGAYPSVCSKIATCVKSCNMAPFQAQNCMMDGYISLDDCKKIYPGCQKTEHDTQCKQDCGVYPQLCGKIDHCVKDCNLSSFQAQNCYHEGIIPLDKCKQIYPQCQ